MFFFEWEGVCVYEMNDLKAGFWLLCGSNVIGLSRGI